MFHVPTKESEKSPLKLMIDPMLVMVILIVIITVMFTMIIIVTIVIPAGIEGTSLQLRHKTRI